MSGSGGLSRHVLSMKFMRRTKDQIEKVKVEEVHREHFAPDAAKGDEKEIKNDSSAPSAGPKVEELWSYNQCESFILGRQSFGGFNPAVEKNIKKGIWKPFYLDEARNADESEDEDMKKQDDVDVSDEEMAKTFGSLVGTLAKRFKKKNKWDKPNKNNQDKAGKNQKDNKGPPRWGKAFQKNKKEDNNGQQQQSRKDKWKNKKRQRESTGSNYGNQDVADSPRQTRSKRQHDNSNDDRVPPQKKRRFLKPSDD